PCAGRWLAQSPATETLPEIPMARFALLLTVALAAGFAAAAEHARDIDCSMTFDLAAWSTFYKTASGKGGVTCDNGQRLAVKITASGGGMAFGKCAIRNGKGEFSGIGDIR